MYKRQVHEGAAVRQMEKRGIKTNIGNLNREIRAANRLMKSIRQLIQNLKVWITELGEKRKELLAQKAAEEATLLPNLLMKYMEIRKEERKDWTRAGQTRGTSQDLKDVSEALSYLRQKGLSTVEAVSYTHLRKVWTDAPVIFKRSPPSQIEHIETDRRIVDISCRPERTGAGTVRHYHGTAESCRGRDRGIEAYLSNGMGEAVQ